MTLQCKLHVINSAASDTDSTRVDFTEAITVVVGEEKKEYILHKAYATKSSDFFKSATTGNWTEAKLKKVVLPSHDPSLFDVYIQWLYTGVIAAENLKVTTTSHGTKDPTGIQRYQCLMKLYELGYYLMDTVFRNAVVTAVLDFQYKVAKTPGLPSINILWPQTPEDCSMKRLITRWWAMGAQESNMVDTFPTEFLHALVKDMIYIRNAKAAGKVIKGPASCDSCEYHDHDEKTPKCKTSESQSPDSSPKRDKPANKRKRED